MNAISSSLLSFTAFANSPTVYNDQFYLEKRFNTEIFVFYSDSHPKQCLIHTLSAGQDWNTSSNSYRSKGGTRHGFKSRPTPTHRHRYSIPIAHITETTVPSLTHFASCSLLCLCYITSVCCLIYCEINLQKIPHIPHMNYFYTPQCLINN